MKVIKNGLFAEDGIHITCDRCGCEYIIESKYDFILELTFNPLPDVMKYCVAYNSFCPDCGNRDAFGWENGCVPHLIFCRKDWKKRYRVVPAEIKVLKDYDEHKLSYYQLKEKKNG